MEMLAIRMSKDHWNEWLDGIQAQHPMNSRGSMNKIVSIAILCSIAMSSILKAQHDISLGNTHGVVQSAIGQYVLFYLQDISSTLDIVTTFAPETTMASSAPSFVTGRTRAMLLRAGQTAWGGHGSGARDLPGFVSLIYTHLISHVYCLHSY